MAMVMLCIGIKIRKPPESNNQVARVKVTGPEPGYVAILKTILDAGKDEKIVKLSFELLSQGRYLPTVMRFTITCERKGYHLMLLMSSWLSIILLSNLKFIRTTII